MVRNLSATGALLDAEETLPVGTLVSLGLAGIGIHLGRVVRPTPAGMAIEFMVPLDLQVIARVGTGDTLVSIAFPQMRVPPRPVATPPSAAIDPNAFVSPALPPGDSSRTMWLIAAAVLVMLAYLLM